MIWKNRITLTKKIDKITITNQNKIFKNDWNDKILTKNQNK